MPNIGPDAALRPGGVAWRARFGARGMAGWAGGLCLWLAAIPGLADEALLGAVERQREAAGELAQEIWALAELGYQEVQSTQRLQSYLAEAGFAIETHVADMPTAFIGQYGQGKPVIGLLAEFDALPGASQAATPQRQPLVAGAPGHACGHHLFGAASVTAAVALKQWLTDTGAAGTLRLYGTPAEEGGSGKVYLVRAGHFDDVDAVLHWHPADRNDASPATSTANKSARITFHGVAAHAAAAPERGRSALDGVEAMNFMVNLMREHIPQEARIHYVITDGGEAPNIVPERASVYYYVRHPDREMVKQLFERVIVAAEAAALGTDTEMTWEVMHGNYPLLPNKTLAMRMDAHLRSLPPLTYNPQERAFALALADTLPAPTIDIDIRAEVQPFKAKHGAGSTDVGDVSWLAPTAGLRIATWVPGTPAHSWQAVAAGGVSIGHAGMMQAARVLALTGADLFRDSNLRMAAQAELVRRRGPDFRYEALLGDRAPPLDYRR